MKTFKAVFTKEMVPVSEAESMKQYTFNTEDEINFSQYFYSEEYKKHLQITFIYGEPYTHVNVKTGEVSNESKSFPFVAIKKIAVNESKAGSTTAE